MEEVGRRSICGNISVKNGGEQRNLESGQSIYKETDGTEGISGENKARTKRLTNCLVQSELCTLAS